jgi:uncharacterized membrane protein
MEMTLSRLGLTDLRAVLTNTVLPIGILALIAMMVLPLPAVLARYFLRRQHISVASHPYGRESTHSARSTSQAFLRFCSSPRFCGWG